MFAWKFAVKYRLVFVRSVTWSVCIYFPLPAPPLSLQRLSIIAATGMGNNSRSAQFYGNKNSLNIKTRERGGREEEKKRDRQTDRQAGRQLER